MDNKYFNLVGKKLLETLLSVKVWTIAAVLVVSTIMVYDGKMDAKTYATMNGSTISVVYALREGFKIRRIKAKAEKGEEIEDKDMLA